MSNLILPRMEAETVTVSYEEMRRIAAAGDVLERWGLQLVCPTCTRLFGHGQDGVQGNNEPGATVLVIRCGCTVRRCEVRGH
jgi:hypothetical protein